MFATIFWVLLLLLAIGIGTSDRWKGGPYLSWGLILVELAILGWKVIPFSP